MNEAPMTIELNAVQQQNLPLWIKRFEEIMIFWQKHNINDLFSIEIAIHDGLTNETILDKSDLSPILEINVLESSSSVPLIYVAIKMNVPNMHDAYEGAEFYFTADKCELVTWHNANISEEFRNVWEEFMEKHGYTGEKDVSLAGDACYVIIDPNYALQVIVNWTNFIVKQDVEYAPGK